MRETKTLIFTILPLFWLTCSDSKNSIGIKQRQDSLASCGQNLPDRFGVLRDSSSFATNKVSHRCMVLIPAGTFNMGAKDKEGREDEYPQHKVKLSSFWMDANEVTNAEFRMFVDATGYLTTAERKPVWEEMKKQLPAGTSKPPDSIFVAASLVFYQPQTIDGLDNAAQWWRWMKGADWKHPHGPKTNINGKDHYPVVHISWDDAMAYCKWSGKRLPTEAEWEYAARGGLKENLYPWGNEDVEKGIAKANTWQGSFPISNTNWDKFGGLAPIKQFKPNGYGLFDMAGNVWEWCSDWYRSDYYKSVGQLATNPIGPTDSFDPIEPGIPKKVVRGGSFMCNVSYCEGYKVTSRMKTSTDTGLEHTGFRCVISNGF